MTILGVELIGEDIANIGQFLLIGGLAVLIMSMAKAGFGGSIGLLAVPMMIYAVGGQADRATGLFLPILIATDYMNIVVWWRKWRWRVAGRLLPGAIVGIIVAWIALDMMGFGDGATTEQAERSRRMANDVMKLGIGVISLGFVIIRGIQVLRAKNMTFRPVMWQSTVAGGIAGVTSTVAHSAGPVTAMYMLPQNLGKNAYVATTAFYYWIGNQLKLAPYIHLDLINRKSLLLGLTLVPAVPIGVVLGRWLAKKVNEKVFSAIVYSLLALTGIDLCRKAIISLTS
ncbi:MAG: sulfite exporter TauE/SafE family protein [Planctomycetota bacterium]|jgi:uncharacterized membrane protein YfcA